MIHYKNLVEETKEKMKSLVKSIEKISKDINIVTSTKSRPKKIYKGGNGNDQNELPWGVFSNEDEKEEETGTETEEYIMDKNKNKNILTKEALEEY
jgi:hypothetical protein